MTGFDIDVIKKQVKDVLAFSQDIPDPQIDELMDQWLASKTPFIEAMDGNLMRDYGEVEFTISSADKTTKFQYFIDLVHSAYKNYGLTNFLEKITSIEFFSNKLNESHKFYSIDDKLINVPAGSKVIKCFKYFEDNPERLENLQNEASRVIQEATVKGHLVVSVHPLDYLSASENTHKWRSCHSLDGDYRSGNLNYMADSSTIICYLKSDKDAILPRFPATVPWNSKKWRMWLHYSDDYYMIFAGRQYPFTAAGALNIIKSTIITDLDMGEEKSGRYTSWRNKKFTSYDDALSGLTYKLRNLIPAGSTLRPLNSVVKDAEETFQYNDILNSTCYDPVYCYKEPRFNFLVNPNKIAGLTKNKTKFIIGKPVKCICCGKRNIAISERMLCHICFDDLKEYETAVCDRCGCRVSPDELFFLEEFDEWVCEDCYDELSNYEEENY